MANCTIRAEHDGFLVYANQQGKPPEVYERAPVRQRQRLFTLPDLSKMEVQALLHETVVNRVKVGMPWSPTSRRSPTSPSGSVEQRLPAPPERTQERAGERRDVFHGQGAAGNIPDNLRPGMSTEIEIMTAEREGVLAVPHTAVTFDGDRHTCTVVTGDTGSTLRMSARDDRRVQP